VRQRQADHDAQPALAHVLGTHALEGKTNRARDLEAIDPRRPAGGESDVLHAQAAPTGSFAAIPTPLESRTCSVIRALRGAR
jgi:hypothetical protein